MSTFEVWYSDGSVSLPKVAIGNGIRYLVYQFQDMQCDLLHIKLFLAI